MGEENSKKTEEINQIIVTDTTVRNMLKENVVKEFDELGKEMGLEANPIAILYVLEPKDEKTKDFMQITVGHPSRRFLLEKKVRIDSDNKEVLQKTVDIMKRI